jgi:HlyD family secretion protein
MAAPKGNTQIFRKVALDRLASPEELDILMQVTKPRTWLVMVALMILVVTTVVWGFVGSIPTRIDAQGVLIKSGGVFDIFATGAGPIAKLTAKAGDLVHQGQVVAEIEQPEMDLKIANTKAQLLEMQRQHAELSSYTRRDLSLNADSSELQRSALEDTVRFSEQRLEALKEQIASEERLLDLGLITKQTVLTTQQSLFTTSDQLERAKNDLKRLVVTDTSTKTQKDQDIIRSQLQLNEAQRNVEFLEEQRRIAAEVVSPYTGRILEVKSNRGDLVNRGSALMSLQLADDQATDVEAVIYVPPKDGKYVEPGMEAQISPLSSPREEYGYIIGKVTYVSEFPATFAGMMRVLGNDVLVKSLSVDGAPFGVYAQLIRNPKSASGYAWSSPKGETLSVNSGTVCLVTITVKQRRPIELVAPYIKEKTGM